MILTAFNQFDRIQAMHPLEYKRLEAESEMKRRREPHLAAGWTPADWAAIQREVRKIRPVEMDV